VLTVAAPTMDLARTTASVAVVHVEGRSVGVVAIISTAGAHMDLPSGNLLWRIKVVNMVEVILTEQVGANKCVRPPPMFTFGNTRNCEAIWCFSDPFMLLKDCL